MRKGFELLLTRSIKEKTDINSLSEKYHVSIPPLFMEFLETYELPLQPSNHFIAYCADEEVGFDDFMSSIELSLQVYNAEESYSIHSMLPFASSGIYSGGVCVCVEGENADKIYLNDEVVDGKYRLIAENIFEFVRGIKEVEDGDDPTIYL